MITESNKMEIVILSDEHIGAITHQEKFLKYAIDYVKDVPYRYWIYLGDGMENNLEGSVGSPLTQTLSPKQQRNKFIKYHKPIADKNIAFNTHSNHPGRTTKKVDINPEEIIADKLGLPYTLPTDEVQVRVGNRIYDIIHSHGATGASTLGGKINAMMKYPLHYDGDIFLMAHVHTLMQWKQFKIRHNKYRELAFMIGGSFLDYFNSYGQTKNYSPTPSQFGSILLTEDAIRFRSFINLDPEINLDE